MTRSPAYLEWHHSNYATADDLFAAIKSGAVKVAVHQRFALKDAAKAQEALAAKKTVGATVLVP